MNDTDHQPEKLDIPASVAPAYRKRRKAWQIALDSLIVLLFIGGLYLVLQPIVLHLMQDNLTRQLSEAYGDGEGTIVVDPGYLAVPGEDVYYSEGDVTTPSTVNSSTTPVSSQTGETTVPASPSATPTPQPARVTIKAIGWISIPSINCSMPIAEGATRVNLRVAIGHYSNSAGIGQPGNCILFGHRMYTYGRHFNRLGEVIVGQQIILSDKQFRYTYEVDEIDTVLPDQVLDEMYAPVEGSRIMLITCTPIRVASHRLLVKGKLVSTEPLG
jgi:sortase A